MNQPERGGLVLQNLGKPAAFTILGLAFVALSQPIFLLLVWLFRIPSDVVKTTNDFGGIVGAVFTAGGLIVAIVSVFTLLSVQQVVKDAIKPVADSIPKSVDERIGVFLEAYGYFLNAQRITSLEEGALEAFDREFHSAISLQPRITGIYAWRARKYYMNCCNDVLSRAFSGFLYLAVTMDVFSRRIVGWSMSTSLRTQVMLDALDMAIYQRRPQEVIHHSDQGTQYTSIAFGLRCREAGVRPLMGTVADCYDDAMCESFFAGYAA
jgi:hypothetical protein